MPQGRIILDTLVYNDTETSNDPLQKVFDWRQEWDIASISYPTTISSVLGAGEWNDIVPPSDVAIMRWLMIYTNRTLDIITTCKSTGLGPTPPVPSPWTCDTAVGVWIEPMTSGGTVKDGIYFMRGILTGLRIGVPGTDDANVIVFAGF